MFWHSSNYVALRRALGYFTTETSTEDVGGP